jgi:hypothetical protein
MRATHRIPCLVLAASLVSCAPAPVPEARAAYTPPSVAPVVSPAQWLSRHVETFSPTASRNLPHGGVVNGSLYGRRWITGDAPPTARAADGGGGSASLNSARTIVPEPIAGIVLVDQRWTFFGSSGRGYLAASPLGPIEEVRPLPAPVRALSAGRAAVVAVTIAGDVLRTTDGGAHWSPVQAAALYPAVPISIVMRADGAGVILAAPQRAAYTADDGVTWAPLATPGGGPYALQLSEQGDIWLAQDGGPAQRFEVKPPGFTASKPPPSGGHERADKDAWAYEANPVRALSGKRVLSVAGAYQKPWKIEMSELDRDGAWKTVPELEGCDASALPAASAFGGDFIVGCVRAAMTDAGAGAAIDAGAPAPYRTG